MHVHARIRTQTQTHLHTHTRTQDVLIIIGHIVCVEKSTIILFTGNLTIIIISLNE